jgi:hypothetical protein
MRTLLVMIGAWFMLNCLKSSSVLPVITPSPLQRGETRR